MEKRFGGMSVKRSEKLGIIYGAIEKLYNDKSITEEELKLVEEYIKDGDSLARHLKKWNEKWKKSGIDLQELSGDGFARDIVVFEGEEKFIKGRFETINTWEKELAEIKSNVEKFKNRS